MTLTARSMTACALLIAGATAACGLASVSPTSPAQDSANRETISASPDEEFNLRPTQSAQITGEALVVRFDTVESDSRCPVDTTCVWEGDAVLGVTLQVSRQRTTVMLHTAAAFAREATFERYRIGLRGLAPARRDGRDIPAEQYNATFIVSRQ